MIKDYEFDEIKIVKKNEKIIIGYVNKIYKKFLYPLFEGKINDWTKRVKFYSNYDKLTFINLFSNRSFKDIYQYPIFPMLYNHINYKRDMSKHIGFQELCDSAKTRAEMIKTAYKYTLDESEENPISGIIRLFNTHYSNPVYVSNFLMRLFPYSFPCIELQGDNFDSAARLFYTVEGMMKNTLTQKSDLRELIPELFYLPEMFINKNKIDFGQLENNDTIDNVKINGKNDQFEKYKFLSEMRDNLEKESNINLWIDLIFGINQKENKNKEIYYEKESYVKYENNKKILFDKINMESTDFGLLPYQLFDKKFPSFKINDDLIKKLEEYNIERIDKEHFVNADNPLKIFVCLGCNSLDPNYLKIINKSSGNIIGENNAKINNNIYFLGDVFGSVKILNMKIKKIMKKNYQNQKLRK